MLIQPPGTAACIAWLPGTRPVLPGTRRLCGMCCISQLAKQAIANKHITFPIADTMDCWCSVKMAGSMCLQPPIDKQFNHTGQHPQDKCPYTSRCRSCRGGSCHSNHALHPQYCENHCKARLAWCTWCTARCQPHTGKAHARVSYKQRYGAYDTMRLTGQHICLRQQTRIVMRWCQADTDTHTEKNARAAY